MPGPYHNPTLSDPCSRARVNSHRQGLRWQLVSAGSVCVWRGGGAHYQPHSWPLGSRWCVGNFTGPREKGACGELAGLRHR